MTQPMTKDSDFFLPPKMEALKGHVKKDEMFAEHHHNDAIEKNDVDIYLDDNKDVQPKIFLPPTEADLEQSFNNTLKESRFDYHPAMLNQEIFTETEESLATHNIQSKSVLERKSTLSMLLLILAFIGVANIIVITNNKTLDVSLSSGRSYNKINTEIVRDMPLIINETDAVDAPVISVPSNNTANNLELFKRSKTNK